VEQISVTPQYIITTRLNREELVALADGPVSHFFCEKEKEEIRRVLLTPPLYALFEQHWRSMCDDSVTPIPRDSSVTKTDLDAVEKAFEYISCVRRYVHHTYKDLRGFSRSYAKH